MFVTVVLFCFLETVFLCGPRWSGPCYVVQVHLKPIAILMPQPPGPLPWLGQDSAVVFKSAAQSWSAGSLFRVCFKSSIWLSCFPFPLNSTSFILHYHCLCKRKLRSWRYKCFLTYKRSHLSEPIKRWRPLKLRALSVCLITKSLGSAPSDSEQTQCSFINLQLGKII